MTRVLAFVLFGLLMGGQFLAAQHPIVPAQRFPVSHTRILVGWEAGTPMDRIAAILGAEGCFVAPDERMWAGGEGSTSRMAGWMLGWMDPRKPNAPTTDAAVYALLDRLAQQPEVRFAHPFVQTPLDVRGVTDEVVVKLRPGMGAAVVNAVAEQTGAIVLGENPFLRGVYRLRVDKHAGTDPVSLALYLKHDARFAYAEPNYLFNPSVNSNDPFFGYQWALKNTGSLNQGSGTPGADMEVVNAWAITTGDSTVRIAIIDSGTDTLHADLLDNLLPGYDATGGGSKGYPNTTYPSDGHGTSCAGVAAAKHENGMGTAGVCPDCSVFPVKIFYYLFNPFGEPLPYASGTSMADGISWAWQVGDADILSNSWGLFDNLLPLLPGGTSIVEDAIQMAMDSARDGKGGLLFFSSGNDGGAPLWPGRQEGCFSVNATTMCDERKHPTSCDGDNWEGNWGLNLDVSAPGVRIPASDMRGGNGFESGDYTLTFGGTSAACPNAAGVMGLVLSVAPYLNLEQAHYVLETTCEKVGGYNYGTTLTNGSWSLELGYGRLNAHDAVTAAQNIAAASQPTSGIGGFTISPQPATERLDLIITPTRPEQVALEIIDLQGRVLYHQDLGQVGPNSYRMSLSIRELVPAAGMYALRLQTTNGRLTKKFLVIQ